MHGYIRQTTTKDLKKPCLELSTSYSFPGRESQIHPVPQSSMKIDASSLVSVHVPSSDSLGDTFGQYGFAHVLSSFRRGDGRSTVELRANRCSAVARHGVDATDAEQECDVFLPGLAQLDCRTAVFDGGSWSLDRICISKMASSVWAGSITYKFGSGGIMAAVD